MDNTYRYKKTASINQPTHWITATAPHSYDSHPSRTSRTTQPLAKTVLKSISLLSVILFGINTAFADTVAERLSNGQGCQVLALGEGAYSSHGSYVKVVPYDEYPAYDAQGFLIYNYCTNMPHNPSGYFPALMAINNDNWIDIDKELGRERHDLICKAPNKLVHDPINISIGNVFLEEEDYQTNTENTGPSLSFSRYYNSATGVWSHTYGARLNIGTLSISLVNEDGRVSTFSVNTLNGDTTEHGILKKQDDHWSYTSEAQKEFTFNSNGELTAVNYAGNQTTISRQNGLITVLNANGKTLTFTEDSSHQPTSLTFDGGKITYQYNSNSRLINTSSTNTNTNTNTNTSTARHYFYNNPNDNKLLTSVIDERDTPISTWDYDIKGRAILNNGPYGGITISYQETRTTLTNELGKKTNYFFTTINHSSRITALEGEPTADCSASNSSFTYNDSGQILTKTDAQGYITTYTYNDRGLETSRTEASGTPLARTTTTEWDPVRFLPTKVVTPTQTTLYTYDDQGRQLSQQTTMTSTN